MTDSELPAFFDLFSTMTRVFYLKGDEVSLRTVAGAYFKAFRNHRLKDIQAGADAWMLSGKRFPKPAEWLEVVPRRPQGQDYAVMTDVQAREYTRAEQLRYEDTPCTCQHCVSAGVSERPLRFVPEIDADDRDKRMRDPFRDRVVVSGHWAHGFELAGYYRGKDDFWNKMLEQFGAGKPEDRAATRKRLEDAMAHVGEEGPSEDANG